MDDISNIVEHQRRFFRDGKSRNVNYRKDQLKRLKRVLQENEIKRVGGTNPIKIDTRVIFATNVELEDAVEKGAGGAVYGDRPRSQEPAHVGEAA